MMDNMDERAYVLGCLQHTEDRLSDIARHTGLGESWLRMFKRGDIPDPSYSRIKALAKYFERQRA